MESRAKSHPRLRSILVMIIFASLICYCVGLAVLQVNNVVRRTAAGRTLSPTSAPTQTQPSTPTIPGVPSPFYITNTPSQTPTITITFTPSLTFTEFVPPTRTITPSPSNTLSPSPVPVTNTPTPEPATPIVVTLTSEGNITPSTP